jgi:hypothetical protein
LGEWQNIFQGIADPRKTHLIKYPLSQLLCAGVLLYIFRLGSRREANYKLRGNMPSAIKFESWFGVQDAPHGDTLNYAFQKVAVDEVQEVVCRLASELIRKKVLSKYRLLGTYYLVVIDGTGVLSFRQRHCPHCLTQRLSNGEIRYYHPVLEAKLVTENGFAISMMTEFIENADLHEDKQDCELKAFYRLTKRLKARFPRLPVCLLLDGLYAGGPTFQLCQDSDWKFLIVLQDDDLSNVHRSFEYVMPHLSYNHKQVCLGKDGQINQHYRWVSDIEYQDTKNHLHNLNVLECREQTSPQQEKTTKYMWLTNFTLTSYNVDKLANQGGRLRWKIENEGFNAQKNGGFNLQHPISHNENARKVFYLLLQIAHLIVQLIEKGSLLRHFFPKGWGSSKNLAFLLLETWRNLRLSLDNLCNLYDGRYQIRFDSS